MLTPAELGEMLAGASWREEREWKRVAWQTAHGLNVSGKMLRRTVTADELLGRKREMVVKDPHAKFAELWRRKQEREKAQELAEKEAADGS